jgi:hypothetical protein
MRLARRENDYWELLSAEDSHQSNLDTFAIPSLEEREGLKRGQAAKRIFDIEGVEGGQVLVQGERMWVIVAERIGDVLHRAFGQPTGVH